MIFDPFKPHKVQFSNGKYGIRKLNILGWEYLDLHCGYYWSKRSIHFKDCMTNDPDLLSLFVVTEKIIK